MIDALLTLDPEKRPDADSMLDHRFLFEDPLPAEDVSDLLKSIPVRAAYISPHPSCYLQANMFEYTAGRGAHANRGRQHNAGQRPPRPAMAGANPTNTSQLSGYVDRLY